MATLVKQNQELPVEWEVMQANLTNMVDSDWDLAVDKVTPIIMFIKKIAKVHREASALLVRVLNQVVMLEHHEVLTL